MAGHLDDGEAGMSETHDINVTPFIDVMLVLLIIFMVVAPLSTVDVPVDLPTSTAKPQPKDDKPLFLTIQPDLTVSIGDTPVAKDQLLSELDLATSGDKEKRIFLRADKIVPYGDFMTILDQLRTAGYIKLALVGIEAPK